MKDSTVHWTVQTVATLSLSNERIVVVITVVNELLNISLMA